MFIPVLYCSAILNLSPSLLVALSPFNIKGKKKGLLRMTEKICFYRELTEIAKAKKAQQAISFACVNGNKETGNWEGPVLHQCQSSDTDLLALSCAREHPASEVLPLLKSL